MRTHHPLRTVIVTAAAAALFTGCAPSTPSGGDGAGTSSPSSSAPAGDGSALSRDADLRTDAPSVSAQEAVRIATGETGDGVLHAIELDWSDRDGVWEWEIKVLGDGGEDHKVVIDANSGEILKHERESTNDHEEAVSLTDPMSYDEALKLATGEVEGAVRGWKLEWDDGRAEYQFDILPVGAADSTEVTIDASTGNVTVE